MEGLNWVRMVNPTKYLVKSRVEVGQTRCQTCVDEEIGLFYFYISTFAVDVQKTENSLSHMLQDKSLWDI
jgi:hypothetical protein